MPSLSASDHILQLAAEHGVLGVEDEDVHDRDQQSQILYPGGDPR
jgi:hypothetical protein